MGFHFNKSDRIQLKIYICILGCILLLFLFLGQLFFGRGNTERPDMAGNGDETTEEPEIQVRKLSNSWVIDTSDTGVLLYVDGVEKCYEFGEKEGVSFQPLEKVSEQIADVLLWDDRVVAIEPKTEKIHGVILGADENGIEVKEYGYLPLAEDYKGYRIFDTLEMCTYRDLVFGYDFADLVLSGGQVCAVLLTREETMSDIRVLIKTKNFAEILHEKIVVSSDSDFTISYRKGEDWMEEVFPAGEKVEIQYDSEFFASNRCILKPSVMTGKLFLHNVDRSHGITGYRGWMELVKKDDRFALINQVSLEEYLYSVVPSEMPSTYPIEALKAQAVCARTYAYGHMEHAAYPEFGAHVDDSTSYQVYHNIAEQESTTKAVKETHGMLLYTKEGQLAETYYYSTSCGVGSDATVWKTEKAAELTYLKPLRISGNGKGDTREALYDGEEEIASLVEEETFRDYITTVDSNDFEANEGWYRWSYSVKKIEIAHMNEVLQNRYQVKPELILTKTDRGFISQMPEAFQKITNLYVEKRGPGGIADEVILETDKGIYKVISEHNIRYLLCDGKTEVLLSNGKSMAMPNLLPSAFFVMDTTEKKGKITGYQLVGGGFGHGVGMSQNAAKNMAKAGFDWEAVLLFFYEDCKLTKIY